MKKAWNEQQALITGGASGIGLAIATKLHSLGVKVVICDLDAQKCAAACKTVGDNCRALSVDVADLKAVESAFAKIIDESGAIDILVNCAGMTGITHVKSHEIDPAN